MTISRFLLGLALITPFAAPAAAQPLADPLAQGYQTSRLSDDELGAITGMALAPRFGQNARLMSDDNAASFARQTGTISVITFDNWFADVGSVLIAGNLLSR